MHSSLHMHEYYTIHPNKSNIHTHTHINRSTLSTLFVRYYYKLAQYISIFHPTKKMNWYSAHFIHVTITVAVQRRKRSYYFLSIRRCVCVAHLAHSHTNTQWRTKKNSNGAAKGHQHTTILCTCKGLNLTFLRFCNVRFHSTQSLVKR